MWKISTPLDTESFSEKLQSIRDKTSSCSVGGEWGKLVQLYDEARSRPQLANELRCLIVSLQNAKSARTYQYQIHCVNCQMTSGMMYPAFPDSQYVENNFQKEALQCFQVVTLKH